MDQPTDEMLANGSLPELHKTGSFGGSVGEKLETLRRHQPTGPLMCAEFWDGWFDHWGDHHHVTSVEQDAAQLDEMLSQGASVNIYMFHGGTNFGLTNGANHEGAYEPVVTSYDYDAPLDEAGNPTAKYWAFREVLAKYTALDEATPSYPGPAQTFTVPLSHSCSLWDAVDELGEPQWHDRLPTADDVEPYEGLILYRAEVDITGPVVFEVAEVRDRAQVFVNRQGVGTLERTLHDRAIALPEDSRGALELLVEIQGRVGYGSRVGEHTGLIGPAKLNGVELQRWATQPLDLDQIAAVSERLATRSPDLLTGACGPSARRLRL